MKKFILVIDTQYDFMMSDGALPVEGAEEIIAPGIKFLGNLDPDETVGVLFTYDTHREDEYMGSPENVGNPDAGEPGFPIHCEELTAGWQNVFNPNILTGNIWAGTLRKGVFNMWEEEGLLVDYDNGDVSKLPTYSKDREEFFRKLKNDTDTVQVIGVASDFCVRWAIDGLLKRGFNVEVVEHLTAGILKPIDEMLKEPGYEKVKLV